MCYTNAGLLTVELMEPLFVHSSHAPTVSPFPLPAEYDFNNPRTLAAKYIANKGLPLRMRKALLQSGWVGEAR